MLSSNNFLMGVRGFLKLKSTLCAIFRKMIFFFSKSTQSKTDKGKDGLFFKKKLTLTIEQNYCRNYVNL